MTLALAPRREDDLALDPDAQPHAPRASAPCAMCASSASSLRCGSGRPAEQPPAARIGDAASARVAGGEAGDRADVGQPHPALVVGVLDDVDRLRPLKA